MNDEGLTLVAVPASAGLKLDQDLLSALDGSRARVLAGVVSRRELLAEIASGRYRVVHLGGHGQRSGFLVSDGVVSGEMLRQALAAGGVELVVLNWCASIPLAAAVHGQGAAKVISWRADVPDEQAGAWARWFYLALAMQRGDIWGAYQSSVEAFDDAYPAAEHPIWLNGRLATISAELERLKMEQERARAEREERRVVSVVWWAVILGLLLCDGLLSISELRAAFGVPAAVAAPGRAVLLFSVLLVVMGRLRVLR